MTDRRLRTAGSIVLSALFLAAPLIAQSARPARAGATSARPAPSAGPPRLQIAVESVLDRRTSSDFPPPGLTVALSLAGEDAAGVRSVRPRITRAVDDSGRDLSKGAMQVQRGSDGWQPARDEGPPTPRIDLASPSRKAKVIASLEGVLESYLPARDPSASIRIERVTAKKDKPVSVPALAAQHVQVRVLSKAGLEREKKQAEAKKKAEAAKKKGGDGLEAMGEAMADTLTSMLEMLFTSAGDNDLILKVADPGKRIFGFDLAAPDGTPIQSYGTTDYGDFRIVRMLEPIPASASLLVRLKTPRSFAEVPFALTNVKLP